MDVEVFKVLELTKGIWKPGSFNGKSVAMNKEITVAIVLHSSNNFVEIAKSYIKQGNKMLFEKTIPKKH